MIRFWAIFAIIVLIAFAVWATSRQDPVPPPGPKSMADCNNEREIGNYYRCLHMTSRENLRVIDVHKDRK